MNTAGEIQEQLEMLRLEAAAVLDGEQAQFVEALIDAGTRVGFAKAKLACFVVAVAALGGPETMDNLLKEIGQWAEREQRAGAQKRVFGGEQG